jgi:nucleoside-diphosphate-sugar epimerase
MEQKEILIGNEAQLEDMLSEPTSGLIKDISKINDDIMILGCGGKMGPTLTKMAKRAMDSANIKKKVIAVDKFITPELKQDLENHGIEIISCDLMNHKELSKLPDIKNIIYMAGRKFGSTGNEYLTWAINTFLPGLVSQRFPNSRIVAFSTGNVYPLTPAGEGGSKETDPLGPVGEYAESCLGRERIFEHFSIENKTPVLIFRLFYAIGVRYGVLTDVAQNVYAGNPVDLSVNNVTVIWQQEANAIALQSLKLCESPPAKLNVSSQQIYKVEDIANKFGKIFNKTPSFVNKGADTALLCNASKCKDIFGELEVSLDQMIKWTADWIKREGATLGKPTHFDARDGKF